MTGKRKSSAAELSSDERFLNALETIAHQLTVRNVMHRLTTGLSPHDVDALVAAEVAARTGVDPVDPDEGSDRQEPEGEGGSETA